MVADAQVDHALRIAAEDPEALLAVVGPTASGKTELALRIAERTGGEIIGADSVQVYRGFDIGSGKPTAVQRARAPHHLIDVLAPLDHADAARFASLANAAIDDVRARGRRPIVCGGTFLWVKALLFGLAEAPPAKRSALVTARSPSPTAVPRFTPSSPRSIRSSPPASTRTTSSASVVRSKSTSSPGSR